MSSFKRKVKAAPSSSGADSIAVAEGGGGSNGDQTISSITTANNNFSSFHSVTPITGWKPWVHTGLGIISSGHRQLDDLIGGGIPLGTMSLYLTENYSAFGQTLFAYNVAEGLSHGHDNLIIVDNGHEAEKLLRMLPLNLNLEKIEPSVNNNVVATASFPISSTESRDEANNQKENQQGYGLKIAWQYEKYLSE
jgi:elongator complex protein 4